MSTLAFSCYQMHAWFKLLGNLRAFSGYTYTCTLTMCKHTNITSESVWLVTVCKVYFHFTPLISTSFRHGVAMVNFLAIISASSTYCFHHFYLYIYLPDTYPTLEESDWGSGHELLLSTLPNMNVQCAHVLYTTCDCIMQSHVVAQ